MKESTILLEGDVLEYLGGFVRGEDCYHFELGYDWLISPTDNVSHLGVWQRVSVANI